MKGRTGMSKRRLWTVVGITVLVLLIGGRILSQRQKAKAKVELPIAVRVAPPRVGPVYDLIELSGTITAKEEANAYSKVPGKLLRYARAEGDRVAKDEVLAWVERDEIGLTFEPAPVRSPIAGLVAQRFLEIGAAVSPGGTPVALVVNPAQLEVVVNVIEKDASRVRSGQRARVRVTGYPDETFVGTVSRVSPVVDRASRTTRVVVALAPSGGRLRPGMFADVDLVVGEKPSSLLLPQEALLKQNQQVYVYLTAGDDRVQRRDVTLGWAQGAEVEVIDGLAPQDRVVVEGQTRLTAGSRIQVVQGE